MARFDRLFSSRLVRIGNKKSASSTLSAGKLRKRSFVAGFSLWRLAAAPNVGKPNIAVTRGNLSVVNWGIERREPRLLRTL